MVDHVKLLKDALQLAEREMQLVEQRLQTLRDVWLNRADSKATDNLERLSKAEELRSQLLDRYFLLLDNLVTLESVVAEANEEVLKENSNG